MLVRHGRRPWGIWGGKLLLPDGFGHAWSSRKDIGISAIAGTVDITDISPPFAIDGGEASGTCRRR